MLCFTPDSALRFGLHGALWGRGGLSPGGGIGCELFSEEALGARWGYQRVSLLLQLLGLSSMAHASADISLSGEDVRAGAQRAQYELGISCAKLFRSGVIGDAFDGDAYFALPGFKEYVERRGWLHRIPYPPTMSKEFVVGTGRDIASTQG